MKLRTLLPLTFWLTVAFAFVMAVLPRPPGLLFDLSDKLQHIVAFVVLTALAAGAYPRVSLLVIGFSLSAFGALIELVQLIPPLHRDSQWLDWAADTAAVLAVCAIVFLWRRLRAQTPEIGEPTR